jgi:gliding motility-associated-like protein
MLPMQTIVSNQNITTISENPIATVPLTLETEPVSNVQEEVLILPNIFTPNGDGKNDELSIDLSAFEFVDYSLVILDGKNQIVFKSNDPNESWNGKKLDGDMCPAGSYVYYLTGKTSNDKTISKYATLRIQY